MAKTPANHGKHWTKADVSALKSEIAHDTPTRVIGLHMQRTPEAIYAKASDLGLSLKPVNQSPYDKKPKKWP